LKEDEEIDQARAVQMIFRPGLSTAQEVTEIAGRGIGLDVVSSEIGALGGSLDVHSTPGKGLNFIIRLPAH
jgi:chemosensory pili system protein ChpA (sensor histidine kinase/response regulator)